MLQQQLITAMSAAAILVAVASIAPAADRVDRATGLTLLFEGDETLASYAENPPLVSGGFVYKGETETHWIGDVHYITDNTSSPENARYVDTGLHVRKRKGIDLGESKGSKKLTITTVVLQKPTIQTNPAGDKAAQFELIAYDATKGRNARFLFNKKFAFAPREITGTLKRHPAAHTKRSMLTGNYHVHTAFGPVEVLDTRKISTEMLDGFHNKKVTVTGVYQRNRSLLVRGNELVQRPSVAAGTRLSLQPAIRPGKIALAK